MVKMKVVLSLGTAFAHRHYTAAKNVTETTHRHNRAKTNPAQVSFETKSITRSLPVTLAWPRGGVGVSSGLKIQGGQQAEPLKRVWRRSPKAGSRDPG